MADVRHVSLGVYAMKHYYCIANDPQGIEITPRTLSRVLQGKYCVPDCVDYESKFNIPRKVSAKEIYTGWNCHNCRFLEETLTRKKTSPDSHPPASTPPPATITREDISKQVSSKAGMSHRRADKIIIKALSAIIGSLSKRQEVKLENFGKFEVKERKGWNGRHPVSGKQTRIQNRPAVRFTPGKNLKQKLADTKKDTTAKPDEA